MDARAGRQRRARRPNICTESKKTTIIHNHDEDDDGATSLAESNGTAQHAHSPLPISRWDVVRTVFYQITVGLFVTSVLFTVAATQASGRPGIWLAGLRSSLGLLWSFPQNIIAWMLQLDGSAVGRQIQQIIRVLTAFSRTVWNMVMDAAEPAMIDPPRPLLLARSLHSNPHGVDSHSHHRDSRCGK